MSIDSDQSLLREFDTFFTAGLDVPRSVSNIHYKGTIPSIKQIFVYNPWDADATNVELTYSTNSFLGKDNGSGMSPQEVHNFTRVGDSMKVGKGKISLSGRRRYGELGFGTKLLPKLCGFWTLKTWKGGELSVIEQEVDEEKLRTDIPLKVKVYRADQRLCGTELLLEDLTFDSDFSLDTLIKRLQWEVMILPDFQISVNGEQLVSKPIENAAKYQFEAEGHRMGKVDGMICLTTRKPALPGIFVYVNGRSIGDPYERAMRLCNTQGMVSKLIGIINADSLQGAVMLGSEQFKEGDYGVKELDKELKTFLLRVRQEYERTQTTQKVIGLKDRLPQIIDEVRGSLAGKGFSLMKRAGSLRLAYDSEKIGEGEPVSVSPSKDTIILNPRSSIFQVDASTSVREYQTKVLYHVLDILAIIAGKGKDTLREFLARRGNFLTQFYKEGGEVCLEGKSEISLIQMYSALELPEFSSMGITPRAIRECTHHDLLRSNAGAISGKDFLNFEARFTGFSPLTDIVYGKYAEDNSTFHLDRTKKLIEMGGETALPFVYNVSRNGDPYYVIDGAFVDSFMDMLEGVDLRCANVDVAKHFRKLRDEQLTPDQFIERFSNPERQNGKKRQSKPIDTELIPKVITYAQNHDLLLRGNRGVQMHFCVGDFVHAYQVMRGCDWVRDQDYEKVVSRTTKLPK